MKQLPLLASGLLVSLAALGQVTGGNGGGGGVTGPIQSSIATVTICPSNAINPQGCNVTLSGTADQTLINSAISSCGNSNMSAAFQGQTSGTTLTVNSIQSGQLSVYMDLSDGGVNITASTWYISAQLSGPTGGTGTYTVSKLGGGSIGTIAAEAMTGYNPGLGNGCKVFLRAGTVNVTGPIIIDRSYIDLEGENQPMWGSFSHFWNNTTPAGIVGTNNTQILTTADPGMTTGIVQVITTNIPDNGEARHRAIRIANLYIVGWTISGINYHGWGIYSSAAHDNCLIENNVIQRTNTAIIGSWDTGTIRHNSLQDNLSAIYLSGSGVNVSITNNIFFDIGGIAVQVYGADQLITFNKFGDCLGDCIFLSTTGTVVSGNQFSSTAARAINVNYNGNTVVGNTIDYSNGNAYTRSLSAIEVTAGGSLGKGNTIVGNTLIGAGTEPAGVYGIKIDSGGPAFNVVEGNDLYGTNGTAWNNATGISILDSGTSDMVRNNPGDLLTGNPTPTVSSGFGSTPSVTASQGYLSFSINVGTGGSATSGVIALPTAPTGWSCAIADTGATPTGQTEQTGSTVSTATFTNYSRTTGLAVAWTASEIIKGGCTWN